MPVVDAILFNGTVGAGKTTSAEAVSVLEPGPHAVIDVDALRRLHPAPEGDPFQGAVALANLRDVARNYRAAGAHRFVLAGVVETRTDVGAYRRALGVDGLLVVRLVVRDSDRESRLRIRHRDDPEALVWHLRRGPELDAILASAGTEDLVVDTTRTTPAAVAHRVRAAAGWS